MEANNETIKRIISSEKTRPRSATGFFVVSAIFFIAFVVLATLVRNGMTSNFDWTISKDFLAVRSPGLNTLVEGITYVGEWEVIAIICLLLLLFSSSWINLGIPVTICAAITTVIRGLIKPLVARPRPDDIYWLVEEDGFSFPSGHSITSMGVYALLIFLIWFYYKNGINFTKKAMTKGKMIAITALVAFFAVAIGLSRIYVGVHFFVDVTAGWCAGLAVGALIAGFVVYLTNHEDKFAGPRKKLKEIRAKEEAIEQEREEFRL